MSSPNKVMIELEGMSKTFVYFVPKPWHYKDSHETTLIISTECNENNAGIYEYNIKTNKISLICNYNYINFRPVNQGQFIINNILCIFGGNAGKNSSIALLNLKTKQITYNQTNMLKYSGWVSSTVYIPSPWNQIHSSEAALHYVFDIDSNSVVTHDLPDATFPKLLYVPYYKQLMILGSYKHDKIFYCDISKDTKCCNWKDHPLIMPHAVDMDTYDLLLAFNKFIFVFYFAHSGYTDIYCMDITHNKWYKSEYQTPKSADSSSNVYAIKYGNNDVHIVDFSKGLHFKTSLFDVIPNDLTKFYRGYYQLLIIGYIKEQENTHTIPTIPFVLKQLILMYYPLFI